MTTEISTLRRREFLGGVRAVLPILLGVAPFGMIYGALARDAGLGPVEAQAMSSIVFAGSAQFLIAGLIKINAPAFIIVASVVVINLRHALYSASMAPRLSGLRWPVKVLIAYLLTDEAYATVIPRYRERADPVGPDLRHWHFLGVGLSLWLCWQATTALGVFLGAAIPAAWQLDFTLPLTFIAIVVPGIRNRPALAAAVVAGVVSILAFGLEFKLGLIVAAIAGIVAGGLAERVLARE
ncbi:MAG TPA: AzlC family ABC transporter permease [Thermoflexales bacterium]|jgi:4-azaleucine resistance transporter AzlC|nr:AzlC family ABC transporter permease [Thermoflexales bacterium]HQX11977.1 AzlC family ABC transporter permease [Thermoflexales bacterium]HQZ55441.1 AzlC family ABC transporter permease [Thermoflexales bacterium]HRA52254.1 AzlC family ABC transporter permease [Thermoflexales bacterium]